ncbi:esterase/lipase family protein [Singulisphaera sp. PoT]|uniref:esterase/lipase family protein n=1 Tax=Singulisphaera sp. PoT TaxID=3411797 RepID=UPI003BF5E3B2
MTGLIRWLPLAIITGLPACYTRGLQAAEPRALNGPATAQVYRYDPSGLSLLRPYSRGKVPVVLVHGLWSKPWSWHRMIETLEGEPAICERYQFWTFGYRTGASIGYSAHLLRRDLARARSMLDPDRRDDALDRMIVVGHSMGGLLSRMLSVDPGDRLWRVVADRPFGEMIGERADVDLFREGWIFGPTREIRRLIFIATPHRGSRINTGSIHHVGTRIARGPDPLRDAYDRLISRNPPAYFSDRFRAGLPTSVDELEWESPLLTALHDLPVAPSVSTHSIIAVRPDPLTVTRSDGLVTFESASIAGARSEKVIVAGHLCQDHPEVIGEVRRILLEDPARAGQAIAPDG